MLTRITAVAVVMIAVIGWALAAFQLVTNRWPDSTGLLLLTAVGATVGSGCDIPALAQRRLGVTIAGLLLVGVAASIFAYPLSAVVLVLLIAIIGRAVSEHHQSANPASV